MLYHNFTKYHVLYFFYNTKMVEFNTIDKQMYTTANLKVNTYLEIKISVAISLNFPGMTVKYCSTII